MENEGAGKCHHICLTPTKNEAWIIKHFIAANSIWASQLVVADQGSTDSTRELLRNRPKVNLILNDSPVFDERHRQRLLIDGARRFEGKRVLIALDADEALSANCLDSPEWRQICNAQPGTVLRFRWVNILPGFKKAWIPKEPTVLGFIDDGSEHKPKQIHSRRVPFPEGAPVIDLQDIVVLHFQYVVWERMESKQRWYQIWEHLHGLEKKKPLQIYRESDHMRGGWAHDEIHEVNPNWFAGYEAAGIDFRTLACESVTWWDSEIVRMLARHGPRHFRRLAIWDKDWNAIARSIGLKGVDLADPRSFWEKSAHRFLAASQKHRATLTVRGFEKLLRALGW